MDSFSQDPCQPVFTPSPPSSDFGLNELANVVSLGPLNSTFGSGLPARSKWFKPVTLFKFYAINPLVNLDDKENEKEEGDKEKVVKIGEVQVFNEKGDTMTLGKRNLSRHQESAQKSMDPKELRSPWCV